MLEYLAFYYYFLNGEENLRQGGNRRILKLRGTQFLFYQLEVTFLFWKRTSVLIPCQSEEMWCENSVHHHCASLSLFESVFQTSTDIVLKIYIVELYWRDQDLKIGSSFHGG